MKKILNIIEKQFSLVLVLAAVLGIFLPKLFIFMKSSISYLLGIVLLFGFLKIDYKNLLLVLKKPWFLIWLIICQMILLPTVFFLILQFWNLEIAIGVLIIMAIPTAVAAPTMVDLFKGQIPLALIITVLTHLLLPLILPILFFILLGQNIHISILEIFIFLTKVIFVPFIFSIFIRQYGQKLIAKTQAYFKVANIIIIFFVIAAAIAINQNLIIQENKKLLLYLFYFLLLAIILHFFGWLISIKAKPEERITSIITLSYNNMALGLLIAMNFFSGKVVVYCLCYEIIWGFLPLITKLFLKAKGLNFVSRS